MSSPLSRPNISRHSHISVVPVQSILHYTQISGGAGSGCKTKDTHSCETWHPLDWANMCCFAIIGKDFRHSIYPNRNAATVRTSTFLCRSSVAIGRSAIACKRNSLPRNNMCIFDLQLAQIVCDIEMHTQSRTHAIYRNTQTIYCVHTRPCVST